MTDRARKLLLWHAAELKALAARMDPDSFGYENVLKRYESAKEMIKNG